jgi:hypothetical protein
MPKKTSTTKSQELDSPTSDKDYLALVKLVNGYELVSIVDFDDEKESLILIDPMAISIERDAATGLTGVILSDYLVYSGSNEVDISYHDILTMSPLCEEMIEYYFLSLEYSKKIHVPKVKGAMVAATEYLKKMLKVVDKDDENDYDENVSLSEKRSYVANTTFH